MWYSKTWVKGGVTVAYTEAQKEATKKYLRSLKSLSIRITEDEYNKYTNAAQRSGMSLRAFVMEAIEEKISRL